jgi:glycosyltransferase involved in cell wall biosynthesis
MKKNEDQLKVAIVHDWLPVLAGGEKVLKEIIAIYPDADVFTLFNFLDEKQEASLGAKKIHVSYLNKLPGVRKYYRHLLPLHPQAIEDFDLSDYDLIISSSHTVAKGVLTGSHQTHVSYVHSPARYAWDMMHHYLKQAKLTKGLKGYMAKRMLGSFRLWDYRTANGVDYFIANSHHIRKRIWKVYRREAEVVYPSVDVDAFQLQENKEDFYLTASRMVPYKKLDLIAKAFAAMPEKKLYIIGDGPEMQRVKEAAANTPNIVLLGYQETAVMRDYMQRAKAFVFAAEEDFGIVPVEAQACGTPVIAYGAGGALETVIDAEKNDNGTGVFFIQQTPESLQEAVERFETIKEKILPSNCRSNAERLSSDRKSVV